MKNINLTSFLLLLPFFMLAQTFGDFDDASLKQKESSIEPTTGYEYLYKEQYSKYEQNRDGAYDLIVEHFVRIKIYSDESVSQGNIKIPYYAKEELYAIKASSYNMVGTKRIEKSLAKKDIYFNKITEDDHEKTFAIPDVKKGSIIELKYKIRSPYIYVVPRFYFQEEVPVISAKYEIGLLKEFSLTPIPTGLIELDVSSEELNGNRIVSYVASNVPPLKDDAYVLNINDYRSSIKFELRSTQFSGDYIKYYSSTWNKIVENLLENKKFGLQIDARLKELKQFVSEQKGKTQENIVTSCFEYIVRNYNWDKKTSLYSNSVSKTIKNKSGDSGDLNMLLLNLLRKCGIEAHPYLTRQRNYGILNAAYPSLQNLNYLLVCIEAPDGSYQFIDATNTALPMNQLPMRAINIIGFIVKDGKAIPFEMPNPNTYISRSSYTYSLTDNLEQLQGSGKKVLKNYAAKDFRNKYEDNIEEEYQQDVQEEEFELEGEESEEKDNITYVSNILGLTNPNDQISCDLKIFDKESVKKLDDKIFISSMIGYGLENNPFVEEKREFPIFYNQKVKISRAIRFTIPDNYNIESFPEAQILAIPSRNVILKHSIAKINDKELAINIQFEVKDPIIFSDEYQAYRELLELFLARSNEKIILTRN